MDCSHTEGCTRLLLNLKMEQDAEALCKEAGLPAHPALTPEFLNGGTSAHEHISEHKTGTCAARLGSTWVIEQSWKIGVLHSGSFVRGSQCCVCLAFPKHW